MSGPTIGSLCSGYGGLDMAIEEFFGARTAWFSEFEPAPSKVLEKHWPGVPNHGDMTKINWSAVEPVDIIAGGTPCQDLSAAGKRKGMTEGTRSNLWVQMREAVAVIRPSLVIWENVRGAFSARATSEVESEPGLLGEFGPDRPALRALGRVLGDLSDLGYDTEWVGVRASDAGAPHGRFRVFVVAYAASIGRGETVARLRAGESDTARSLAGVASDAESVVGYWSRRAWHWWAEPADGTASDAASGGRDGRAQDALGETLERVATPGHRGDIATDAECDERVREPEQQPRGTTAAGGGIVTTADTERLGSERWGGHGDVARSSRAGETDGEQWERDGDAVDDRRPVDWGKYRPAIDRWERVLGRVAPSPTEPTGKGGAQRLSPAFVEWMMGLDQGWVTDVGLKRTEELKALGNGVVRQQALLALSRMWPRVMGSLAVAS